MAKKLQRKLVYDGLELHFVRKKFNNLMNEQVCDVKQFLIFPQIKVLR